MIKPEQIPIEAVYAVADIVMGDNDTDCLREAIAAAINAWPGVFPVFALQIGNWTEFEEEAVDVAQGLILPLPQEKNDV